MYRTHHRPAVFGLITVLLVILLSGCSGGTGTGSSASSQSDGPFRPNAPVVYEPDAPQTAVIGSEPLTVDVSMQTRVMLWQDIPELAAKAIIQITGADGINYKYFLPLQTLISRFRSPVETVLTQSTGMRTSPDRNIFLSFGRALM